MNNNTTDKTIIKLCRIALMQSSAMKNISEMYEDEGSVEVLAAQSGIIDAMVSIGELVRGLDLKQETLEDKNVKEVMRILNL